MKVSELAQLLAAENLTEAEANLLLNKYLSLYGIKAYAFTYYSNHVKSGQKIQYHCVSKALEPWHVYYLEQTYSDVDRTLEKNFHDTLPLYWDVQEQLKNAKNTREKRMRLESINFGIDKGLSISLHGPNQDFVSLTLHQFKGETCLNNYHEHQFEWLSAAQVFYHFIKKLIRKQNPVKTPNHLTKREKQCLALTAKGWRVEQIARELKISISTVNFHIQNANKKLGCNNKYQASYHYLSL